MTLSPSPTRQRNQPPSSGCGDGRGIRSISLEDAPGRETITQLPCSSVGHALRTRRCGARPPSASLQGRRCARHRWWGIPVADKQHRRPSLAHTHSFFCSVCLNFAFCVLPREEPHECVLFLKHGFSHSCCRPQWSQLRPRQQNSSSDGLQRRSSRIKQSQHRRRRLIR
jgi:hypothetical protein